MFRFRRYPLNVVLTVIFISLIVVVLAIRPPVVSQIRISVVNVLKFPLQIITATTKIMENILNFPFIFRENRNLKKTVGALYSRLVRLEELTQENARLKRMLGLKNKSAYSLVAARVIGGDISNWTSSIIIDKGSLSGISKDAPVVSEYGLVGKIVEVGPDTSRAMLLNDFNLHVPALIQHSREMGLVVGTLQGGCKMIYLSAESDAKVDDIIITSGIGQTFPKGIIIGQVLSLQDNFGGLGKVAVIKPAVNLASLEEVLVIVR